MKGELRIPDRTGHTTVEWDTEQPATVDAALEMYNKLTTGAHDGLRYRAFRMDGNHDGELLSGFDPNAEVIMFITPMAGG